MNGGRGDRRRAALAAVLITDIVGSTRMRVDLGRHYRALLASHDELVSAAIDEQEPLASRDTGDGFEATFDSTLAALDAAIRIQRSMQEHNGAVAPAQRLTVRVVLSAGELVWAGDKPTGLAFAEARRLEETLAGGGEIWCTDVFRTLIGEHTPHLFVDAQEVAFRGLDEPVRVWRVDWAAITPLPELAPLPPALAQHVVELAGRQRELRVLTDRWSMADGDQAALFLLDGEPGIGKSTLAAALADELRQSGAWILHGRCRDQAAPFLPFRQALADFVDAANGGVQFLGRPGPLAPLLDPAINDDSLSPTPTAAASASSSGRKVDPDTGRFELFEGVAHWLRELSAERPVLLLVDDLHLADEATLQMLQHVLRASLPNHLVVLATARTSIEDHTDAFSAALPALVNRRNSWRSLIGPLDPDGVRQFAAQHLGGRPPAEFVDEIRSYTAGNPLFLRGILEAGDTSSMDQTREWLHSNFGVPNDAVDVFAARYEALAPNARRVIDASAVIGSSFDLSLARSAAGLTADEFEIALDDLHRTGLLSRIGSFGSFAHDVIREAAVARLGERTADQHLAVARILEARNDPASYAGELSLHFSHGTQPDDIRRSAEYSLLAAEQALQSLSPSLAAECFQRALDQYNRLDRPIKDDDRCDLLTQLGSALRLAGDRRADDALLEAASVAGDLGDPDRMTSTALATLHGMWDNTGTVNHDKISILERTLAEVGERDLASRAQLLAGLATELTFSDERVRRRELIDTAEQLARSLIDDPAGGTRLLARVLESRHNVLLDPDGLDQRRGLLDELDELSQSLGAMRSFTAASFNYWTGSELGEPERMRRALRTMADVTEVRDHPRLQAIRLHWESAHATLTGRLVDGLQLAQRSYDIHRSLGSPDALVFSVGLRYMSAWHTDRLDTIIDDLTTCCEAVRRIGMRAGLAFALAATNDIDGAIATLETIDLRLFDEPIAHQDQLSTLALVALTAERLDDLERAEACRQLLAPHADVFVFNGTANFGSVHHYLGMLSTMLGSYDEADRHFADALKANTRLSAPALLAETQLAWATALKRRGAPTDSIRANALLENALTAAHELGMTGTEYRCHLASSMP